MKVPTSKWLDLSNDNHGVSILTDSVFACDVQDGTAGLTLLPSPIYAHLTWKNPVDKAKDYDYMEQGWRKGAWRLVFHDGDWRQSRIPEQATAFSNPVIAIDEANHAGS